MNKKLQSNQLFYLLLLSWFLINIVQSILTEITNDETYYALWGNRLDWGYFDHPPMVAVFTAISSWLFSGNLGVRFMTVFIQLVVLLLIWKTIDLKSPSQSHVVRFFAIAASIVMFTAYGFITTPDVPLLFFIALFLWAYRLFLKDNGWMHAILLSAAMAGMIYSKYQAGLFILIIVFSNLRLLLNVKFWSSGIFAIILLLPHIVWQIEHDFPGFQYHLLDRSSGFKWSYLFEYWPNQLAVFNPFTLIAVVWVLVNKRKKDAFDRALYGVIVGFLGFFWLTAIRGHVEPHWTIAASIPMIILIVREAEINLKLKRYISRFVYPSLLLILLARLLVMTDLLPARLGFHGKEAKYVALKNIAGDHPVVFTGSFQNPSLYRYFTGGDAQVISSLYTRKTQFDVWKLDEAMHNKTVFVVGKYEGRSTQFEHAGYTFEGFFTDSLQVTNHMAIAFLLPKHQFSSGETVQLPVAITNHSDHAYDLNHSVFPAEIVVIFNSKKDLLEIPAQFVLNDKSLASGESIEVDIQFMIPQSERDEFQFGVTLKSFFGLTLNSSLTNITIQQ